MIILAMLERSQGRHELAKRRHVEPADLGTETLIMYPAEPARLDVCVRGQPSGRTRATSQPQGALWVGAARRRADRPPAARPPPPPAPPHTPPAPPARPPPRRAAGRAGGGAR